MQYKMFTNVQNITLCCRYRLENCEDNISSDYYRHQLLIQSHPKNSEYYSTYWEILTPCLYFVIPGWSRQKAFTLVII